MRSVFHYTLRSSQPTLESLWSNQPTQKFYCTHILILMVYTLSLFIGFTVCFTDRFLHSHSILFCVMPYLCFVSQYFQDQSINILGFDLCYPFFMMLLDISCVLLSYVTSYNI